jgi:hypothetical protein
MMGRKRPVPGAVAVYLMNEDGTLADYSGSGNHGTFGADAAAPTRTQYGLSFDGGDEILCGTAPDVTAAGLTVMAVVNITVDDTAMAIAAKATGSTATGDGWMLRKTATAGAYQGYAYNGSRARTLPAATGHAAGTWGAVSLVMDGATATVYAGTAPGTPAACVGTSPAAAQQLTIGRTSAASTLWLTGGLAALVVFPRGLTVTELAQELAYLRAVLAPRGVVLP